MADESSRVGAGSTIQSDDLERRRFLQAAGAVAAGVAMTPLASLVDEGEALASPPLGLRAASLYVNRVPQLPNYNDPANSWELGVSFTTASHGQITALRYYKAPGETGAHTGSLWDISGPTPLLLKSVEFKNETSDPLKPWQQQALPVPIPVRPGRRYLVSVNANQRFALTAGGFGSALTVGSLTADTSNGMYGPVGQCPTTPHPNKNDYFRDVVFTPAQTLFTTQTPVHTNLTDNVDYELGMKFTVRRKGLITAIRYWRSPGDTGPQHVGNIWGPGGALPLASVNFEDETASGWQQQALAVPLAVEPGTEYCVSVNVRRYFPDTLNGMAAPAVSNGDLTAVVGGGVYNTQVGQYPQSSYMNGNYFRDVVFVAENPVLLENQLEGHSDWKLTNFATSEIAGYATAVSVNRGGVIDFKVHVPSGGNYTIDLYRLGWYGGKGARKVWSSPGPQPGHNQPLPTQPAAGTNLVDCQAWTTTDTVPLDIEWPSGLYHAKLTELTTQKQAAIWFVVRDDDSRADILFQAPFTTLHAYNNYGSKCLYDHLSNGAPAYKVSMDRPLSQASLYTPGGISDSLPTINSLEHSILHLPHNMAAWLESQGYDVTYVTNLEIHSDSQLALLQRHRTYLSVAHDEYWSQEMRDNVQAARDGGVNLAFFSANTAFWRVRFENQNRVMVCYKDQWALDPNTSDPSTNRFRTPGSYYDPENGLLGVMYIGDAWDPSNANGGFPFVVAGGSASADPYFAHTGLQAGDSMPGLVGFEWDAVVNNGVTPNNLVVLGESPVFTQHVPTDPDTTATYPLNTHAQLAHMVRYTAPSGAKVFAAGSIQWIYGLDSDYLYVKGQRKSFEDDRAKQIATNVFADMSARPSTPSPNAVVFW
jgi:hypothetical protein